MVAGRRKKFSEVVSVDGGTNEVKINFLNAVKHSYIKVIFDNGDSYFMDEDRTIFDKGRHQKIANCVVTLQRLKIEKNARDLLSKLKLFTKIVIGKVSTGPAFSMIDVAIDSAKANKENPVLLCSDGTISNGDLELDLKKCLRDGILELGIQRTNYANSSEVYACHEKSIFEKSNKSALRFEIDPSIDRNALFAVMRLLAS